MGRTVNISLSRTLTSEAVDGFLPKLHSYIVGIGGERVDWILVTLVSRSRQCFQMSNFDPNCVSACYPLNCIMDSGQNVYIVSL